MNDIEPVAGRELDALVAKKVMGWTFCDAHGGHWRGDGQPRGSIHAWAPSTDIAAAWEVVVKLAKPLKVVWTGKVWVCEVFGEPYSHEADTAPLTICRAALKVVKELKAGEEG